MDYFDKYSSNTLASSGNQFYFNANKGNITTGRVFYKITAPGKYNYSLLFTNTVDSTYADGSQSKKDLSCGDWRIISAFAAVCTADTFNENFLVPDNAENINSRLDGFVALTFNGSVGKNVAPDETFCTDPVELSFETGEYLCVEITFSGGMIPYHEESLLPVFIKTEKGWNYNKRMPLPGMVGCDREVQCRIGYIGDSITQGIGVPVNAYTHWNAIFSQKFGNRLAHWNLGLGYARADDMANGKAWANKAKHNDVLFICFGVNDILQGYSADEIKANLEYMVRFFKNEGKRVILQTVPPFDYSDEHLTIWNQVNNFIRHELAEHVELVFDTVTILGENGAPQKPLYGGHPNENGCALWAEKLYEICKDII